MNYSFAHNCQFDGPTLDRIYQDAFGYKADGCFVEVGASNGLDYSNTCGLAKMGWRGLYIEPVPGRAGQCAMNHRDNVRVTTLCCAAGSKDEPGSIWMIPEWGTATSNQGAANSISKKPHSIACDVARLDTLLGARRWPKNYDLLVIDVDYGEIDVLRGCSLHEFRPKLVIIELHEQSSTNPHSKPIQEFASRYFAESGYNKIYADGINTIFQTNE